MPDIQGSMRQTQAGDLFERMGAETREIVVTRGDSPILARHDLSSVGVSEAAPGFAFRRRAPLNDAFLASLSGSGMVRVGERWERLGPGVVYHMPRGLPHAYHACDEGWVVAWAHFAAHVLAGAVRIEAAPADPETYHVAIRHLRRELRGPADPAAVRHWSELVAIHAHRLVSRRPPLADDRLGRVWEAVEAEPSRPWCMENLAAMTGLSAERVRQLCQRHHGLSPMRRVAQVRMQRAAYLLQTTRWTLDAVSEAVGYSSSFTFSTAFKRIVGRSPEAFRAARSEE